MNLRKGLKAKRTFKINLIPLIDVVFLLFFLFAMSFYFTQPSAIHVKLPKAVTSDIVNDKNFTIVVTSENMIYFNDRVTTLEELKTWLGRSYDKKRPVLIKADRRASVGRIVDIWNLGRSAGIERINVATAQE